MAHIAFFILPAAGHVNPTLSVARELVARGHRVTYALSENYRDRVLDTGAEFVPYAMDQDRFWDTMVPKQDSANTRTSRSSEHDDVDAGPDPADTGELRAVLRGRGRPSRRVRVRPVVVLERAHPGGQVGRAGNPSTPTYVANEHWSLHPPVDTAEEQAEDPETGALSRW